MLGLKKEEGKRLKANDEVLFNAGVWSGSKAKELGLIDGIGDYYNVMKNIFGDDIKFKDFSKKKLLGLNKNSYQMVVL